ncbi:unnamed protein product [Medioppia subpectinata]|uniref:Microtubule-associated protein n=1 Tax=Medioppia subpectinata TaxID=1979941 RepID=A0A7R9L0D2_9ACAR|nr:unnamed protein product [Medioppia subpectinata]CAG2112069.1 unnamed protein product [Medioppia subpectinata]
MSTNKSKIAVNCQTPDPKNKTNYVTPNTSTCESPSPTRPDKRIPPIKAQVGLARGPNLTNVRSKIGSLDNIKHRPTGGEKKMETQKLTWNAKPRIGSLENAKHKPHGGEVKVVTKKLEWKVTSKIGSLDNVKHVPGGGQVKIFDERYVPSPSSTPTPGSMTPTPTPDGKENGETLKTLTGARMSAEKLGNRSVASPSSGSDSMTSTPISSASSMRTGA